MKDQIIEKRFARNMKKYVFIDTVVSLLSTVSISAISVSHI